MMFSEQEGPSISFKNIKKAIETNEIEIQTDDYDLEISDNYVQTNDRANISTQTQVTDIISTNEFAKNTLDDEKAKKVLEFLNNVLIIVKYQFQETSSLVRCH